MTYNMSLGNGTKHIVPHNFNRQGSDWQLLNFEGILHVCSVEIERLHANMFSKWVYTQMDRQTDELTGRLITLQHNIIPHNYSIN